MTSNKYFFRALSGCHTKKYILSLFTLSCVLLSSCSNNGTTAETKTLADIDTITKAKAARNTVIQKKSKADVLQAYRKYIASAPEGDISRQRALTRLAELELEVSNELLQEGGDETQPNKYDTAINNTIHLLETTLKDYPDAKNNHKVLYQLAQAYDRTNQYEKSISTLKKLATKYQNSPHYPEAQFRIGESHFARGEYIAAEDAYTEVIFSLENDVFYEKALFKRGWTRYKQELYLEAADDFYLAIERHNFKEIEDGEKSLFQEYMRAMSLAFSYQRDNDSIHQYFTNKPNYPFLYETYESISDAYIKQERYTDAAKVLEEFTLHNPNNRSTPLAKIGIIKIWQQGGFTDQFHQSIDEFYRGYNPKQAYWENQKQNDETAEKVNAAMREYIVQISLVFHSSFDKKRKNTDFKQAEKWYKRYLSHYQAYANKDKIYTLYGELLHSNKNAEEAIQYFELAAFDGDLILDKKSAYSAISVLNEIINPNVASKQQQEWIKKYIRVAQQYIELYPQDKQSEPIAMRGAELAFNGKNYESVINIANKLTDNASDNSRNYTNSLKARSYLELMQYADAESVYLELLENKGSSQSERNTFSDSLALAIYRQAESAQKENQADLALNHFTRIADVAPNSPLAADGLYDAIAMTMQTERWTDAISLINRFNTLYPNNKRKADVTQKLSVAYLNSGDQGKAAKEFERISQFSDNIEIKRASLWKAAELYESKNNVDDAINAYRDYANTYTTPYPAYMEAMFKLTELYKKQGDMQKREFWQTRISRVDDKATKRNKTDRTNFIASKTILELAQIKQNQFNRVQLREPLAVNLGKKKTAMQESVKLFGQASTYGIAEITTEATHNIGQIYLDFSKSLLNSEKPKNLSGDELTQYNILLEDQAFPFEEKAIEFYEANLTRTKDGTTNTWLDASFQQLEKLFPIRYQRKGKVSIYEK